MTSIDNIYSELITLSDTELERIEASLPMDPVLCFILLTETIRVYDYFNLGNPDSVSKCGLSFQELDVMKMGWNLAASLLFKPIDNVRGFPIMESTNETRIQAISLLYQLGCSSLLRRTAEMIKSGILSYEKGIDNYTFFITSIGKTQFLDEMELTYLEDLNNKLISNKEGFYNNWKLVDEKLINHVLRRVGNFLLVNSKDQFSKYKIEDIDSKMLALVKPWDSGKGIMMAYETTTEIDQHFLVIAAEVVKEWRDEAGFHPNAIIDNVTGSDILKIVIFLVALNFKHIHFSDLAAKKYSEISIPQSLTIWCPLSELVEDIALFSGMDKNVVMKVFKTISFKSNDAKLLKRHTTKFMPLIIDMENGYVLRSVSSILRNPLNTIKDLIILRNPTFRDDFLKNREDWLRSYLYALFSGTRYQRVEGNINLRQDKKTITDIDAAIYDNITGELALFQIKWQDYHLNDVKKLRSKASNLTKELDDWSRKVSSWINTQGVSQLIQNLRLKNTKRFDSSNIYLFGLSKNAARMQGYGFTLDEKNIAISTWAQFVRNRTEIGPATSVFGSIFQNLKEQEKDTIVSEPMPVKFKVSDKTFNYKDLWNAIKN